MIVVWLFFLLFPHSHTWLDDKLLVATDSGDILVYGEGGDFRGPIGSSCETPIETIVAYGKGVVCCQVYLHICI